MDCGVHWGAKVRPTYGYSSDGNGNLTRSTGPGGDISYAFTADGLLSKVSTTPTAPSGSPAKTLADYAYGPLGLPEHATLGNGTTWDRSYDALARLTGVCYGVSTCDNPTDYVRWTYDAGGNWTSGIRPDGTTTLAHQQSTGRPLSATDPPGSASYAYDNYSRLTSTTRTPTGGTAETTTYEYTESSVLKLVATGGQTESYTYDGDSRRLSTTTADSVTKFAWDPRS